MFFSHSFRRSDFTYGVAKDQNVESLLCQKTFRRSDFTYGVTKDQNVESLFSEFFLVFDVLIFVVLTIPPKKCVITLGKTNLKILLILKLQVPKISLPIKNILFEEKKIRFNFRISRNRLFCQYSV